MKLQIQNCRAVANTFRRTAGDVLGEARTQKDTELESFAHEVLSRARQLSKLPACHDTRIELERFAPTVHALESARDRARAWRAKCAAFKAWREANA